jgi:predicted ATP-grasp superfamily ATP-dependent carboligase
MSEPDGHDVTIVFFEHNPYMSVELLDLLKNYRIVCYNDDETYRFLKENWDIRSYLNTEFIEEPESDRVAEIILSNQDFLDKVVPSKSSKILFFYMNARMGELVEKANLSILLPKYKLQERIGNKIYLSEICDVLSLPKNETLTFKEIPEDLHMLFSECKSVLGIPFIVQDALGESGWDTSLIYTDDELQEARKKIHHGLRATKYIPNNIPVSVHVCVLEYQTIIRGPWLQLIGFPELSASQFRFTGNDTNQSILDPELTQQIRDMSFRIAEFVKNEGYRGILGIDFLLDRSNGEIYPQEINSRLVGLTRLLTGMQKDQSLYPDLLRHLEAFDAPQYTQRIEDYTQGEIDLSQRDYSQIIVRNNGSERISICKRLTPGIYLSKNGLLEKVKESLFVQDMDEGEVLITYAAHKGCELYPGEVMVRVILKTSVLEHRQYKLRPEAIQLFDTIRKQVTVSDSD